MSLARDLIAAIIDAERALDDQIMKLHSFQNRNDELMQEISNATEGSSHSSAQNMRNQLSVTQKQLETTISQLQSAKTALIRVRTI